MVDVSAPSSAHVGYAHYSAIYFPIARKGFVSLTVRSFAFDRSLAIAGLVAPFCDMPMEFEYGCAREYGASGQPIVEGICDDLRKARFAGRCLEHVAWDFEGLFESLEPADDIVRRVAAARWLRLNPLCVALAREGEDAYFLSKRRFGLSAKDFRAANGPISS